MDAVVDSTVMNTCCRVDRKTRRAAGRACALDRYLEGGRLKLRVDPKLAIVDEWKRTSGEEFIKVLVIKWVDWKALEPVEDLPRMPRDLARELRDLGFNGLLDKIIVKTALALAQRVIASEDSDFWDPADDSKPGRIGDPTAPVAACLKSRAIEVLNLPQLLERV